MKKIIALLTVCVFLLVGCDSSAIADSINKVRKTMENKKAKEVKDGQNRLKLGLSYADSIMICGRLHFNDSMSYQRCVNNVTLLLEKMKLLASKMSSKDTAKLYTHYRKELLKLVPLEKISKAAFLERQRKTGALIQDTVLLCKYKVDSIVAIYEDAIKGKISKEEVALRVEMISDRYNEAMRMSKEGDYQKIQKYRTDNEYKAFERWWKVREESGDKVDWRRQAF
jgi:PBP1b-binding outer membrane lipoprotein LpoB